MTTRRATDGPYTVSNGALIRIVKADGQRPVVLAGVHRTGRFGGKSAGDPLATAWLLAAAPTMRDELVEMRKIVVALIAAEYNVETWDLRRRLDSIDAVLAKSEARGK